MLPLIFILHFNCSVITKVYSGIKMFRQSVLLLPLIISASHFNCSVITKVYSGIQTFRQCVTVAFNNFRFSF